MDLPGAVFESAGVLIAPCKTLPPDRERNSVWETSKRVQSRISHPSGAAATRGAGGADSRVDEIAAGAYDGSEVAVTEGVTVGALAGGGGARFGRGHGREEGGEGADSVKLEVGRH